jgi:hypothetical protein
MEQGKRRFFSVRNETIIGGTRYRPAVCYRISATLQTTIEELEKREQARTYSEETRFISGVAYPVKKAAPVTAALKAVPSAPVRTKKHAAKEPGNMDFM